VESKEREEEEGLTPPHAITAEKRTLRKGLSICQKLRNRRESILLLLIWCYNRGERR